jgi:hypothetical protein
LSEVILGDTPQSFRYDFVTNLEKENKKQMKSCYLVGAFVAVALLVGAVNARAQESAALVEKLVQKGVLSESEGDEVRAALSEEVSKTGYGRMNGGSLAKKVTLFGDLRLRYEYAQDENASRDFGEGNIGSSTNTLKRASENGDTANDRNDLSHVRYRLRFGLKVDFADNLEMGFRLATGTGANSRSANQDLGVLSPGGNPVWNSDNIYIDQAYLKWSPSQYVTLIGGKYDPMKSIVTSNMFLADDMNVEGFTQQFTYKPTEKLTLFANTVQWVYSDINEWDTDQNADDASAAVRVDDGWLYGGQIGAKWEFEPKRSHAQLASGYWYFANAGDQSATALSELGQPNGLGGTFQPTRSNVGSEFQLVDIIGEFKYTPSQGMLKDIPIRPYFHVIWNTAPSPDWVLMRSSTTGGGRQQGKYFVTANSDDASHAAPANVNYNMSDDSLDLSQQCAWRVGLQLGEAKKRGQWEINAYYQELGSDAVPCTLPDPTFANGFTNTAGYAVAGSYAIRDWWTLGAVYMESDFLDENQATMWGQTYRANRQVFQLHTVVKF